MIVIDEAERVLLVGYEPAGGRRVWATVGGGLDPGETHEEAARRELREETGLDVAELGTCVWVREHRFPGLAGFAGQRERYFFVRTPVFEPAPEQTWEQLRAERVSAIRWWTVEEILGAEDAVFAPRRLGALLRELLIGGPPPEPLDVGE